jgi:O-acetyl-ADP-ribose deacetylase (regulator of RNase III)
VREASGDIWTYESADAIVIPTNGQLSGPPGKERAVMGGGPRSVAEQCRRKFPGIDRYLALYIKEDGNKPFVLVNMMRANSKGPYIVSFPTKNHWRNPSDLDLIAASAYALVEIVDTYGWRNVVMPRVGAGLGHISWDAVKSRLAPILDDRFVVLDGTTAEGSAT